MVVWQEISGEMESLTLFITNLLSILLWKNLIN